MKTVDWEIEYPGINFLEIQKTIINDDKPVTVFFLGTGVGKTLTALAMAEGPTLVVCPKQQKLDRTWEKNNEKFALGKNLTVVSKEEFRRDWTEIGYFDTVIFDEGHNMLGVLPETRQRNKVAIPKTSQLFEAALRAGHRVLGDRTEGRFQVIGRQGFGVVQPQEEALLAVEVQEPRRSIVDEPPTPAVGDGWLE